MYQTFEKEGLMRPIREYRFELARKLFDKMEIRGAGPTSTSRREIGPQGGGRLKEGNRTSRSNRCLEKK